MWRATLKSLLAHKLRLVLTALSIMLGVGFVAGTYVLTDTMNAAFTDLFEQTSEGIDVYVHAEQGFEDPTSGNLLPPIPETIVEDVREVPGVARVAGSVQTGFAQFVDKDGEAITPMGPPTLGFSWTDDEVLNPVDIRDGRPPRGDHEVVMDANTAEDHGFEVGDEVQVLFAGGQDRFTISGIATFGETNSLLGATLAIFELDTAQRLFDAEGSVHEIVVAGEEGITPNQLAQRIAQVLPPDVKAVTAEAQNEESADAVGEALGFFNTFLLVFAGVALFVGAFIIFNTFNILITQRTRELALLRAVGASGGQVMRAVLLESAVVGTVASVLGIAFGVVIAILLQLLLRALNIELPTTGIVLQPRTIVVALVSGLVVTMASAVFPARRAARIAPVTALRETAVDQFAGIGRRAVVGGALTVAGLGLVLYPLFAEIGNAISFVGLGVALTFIGVAALAPAFTRQVIGWIGAPFRLGRSVPAKLARENALRNPKRSASTAAALMIGIALVSTFAVMSASFKSSTARVLEETYKADFILTASNSFTGGGFSKSVAEALREREELGVVSPSRFGVMREAGKDANLFVNGFDPATLLDVLNLEMVEGKVEGLGPDEILLSEDAARNRDVGVGDAFEANFAATGRTALRIAGIYVVNQAVNTEYTLSIEAFDRNFPESLDYSVYVTAADGIPVERARQAVEEETEPYPNVQVQDQAEFRETIEGQIDQLLNMVYALLAFAVLIALMGIVNTLVLSVYERTREIGLLRAVGLARVQTKRMIRWESVLVALFGGLLGLALGILFGWSLVTSLRDEGVEVVTIPYVQLLIFLAAAGLAGVVAAYWPAKRAANLDVLKAIQYE